MRTGGMPMSLNGTGRCSRRKPIQCRSRQSLGCAPGGRAPGSGFEGAMEIQIQHQWAYNDTEWRWFCPTCGKGGQWQFQSPDAAKFLGEKHVKRRHRERQ